jgi:hypothetical protein
MRGGACVITVLVLASASLPAHGQSVAPSRTATKTWTAPRTADGRPDLQGVWLIHTATPLERPAALAGRSTLTDEEVAEFRRRAARLFGSGNSDFAVGDGVFQAILANPETYTNPNSTHGATDMVDLEFDNRTSLIVEPQDGRVPTLTPEGRNRQAATNAAFRRPSTAADVGNALRCISWGVPRLGGRYGAGDMAYYQIIQSPGHVVLFMEAGHEARVIPIDNSPHLSSTIRQWNGDSRGHWEGDTLVVDTTNFNRETVYQGSSEHLHLIERFTRTAPDLIMYHLTVDDPTVFTRSWTQEIPLVILSNKANQIFESACHDGNYSMVGILAGARELEREKASARKRK